MSDRIKSTKDEIFLESNGEFLRLIKVVGEDDSLILHIQSRKFESAGIIKDKMKGIKLDEIIAENGDIINLFTQLKKEDVVEFIAEFIKWINKKTGR
jgi:hypothetical protein